MSMCTWASSSCLYFFTSLLSSNVAPFFLGNIASSFYFFFSIIFFTFDFLSLGMPLFFLFLFSILDFFLRHDFFLFNKFGRLLFFVWLFVTFFVLIRYHSLTRVYE